VFGAVEFGWSLLRPPPSSARRGGAGEEGAGSRGKRGKEGELCMLGWIGVGPTWTEVVIDCLLLPAGWWFVIVGPVVGLLALEVVGCRVGWGVVGGAPVRPEPSSSASWWVGWCLDLVGGVLY